MSNAFFVYTLQHQFHWAMVGAIDFVMDGGRLYLRNEAVGNDEVVDAQPAFFSRAWKRYDHQEYAPSRSVGSFFLFNGYLSNFLLSLSPLSNTLI